MCMCVRVCVLCVSHPEKGYRREGEGVPGRKEGEGDDNNPCHLQDQKLSLISVS